MDLVFAFGNVIDLKDEDKKEQEDKDEDEDDEDVDYKHEKSSIEEKHMDIGEIESKLKRNDLNYITKNMYQVDSNYYDYIVPRDFIDMMKNYKTKYKKQTDDGYPHNKRFIMMVDRRRSENQSTPKKPISEDYIHDKLYLYEPPSNCRDIPKNAVPEWGISASKTCILPNIDHGNDNKGENGCNIGACSDCKGSLLTFSFHVIEKDVIRCYLYWDGQCILFVPNDIKTVLTKIFNMKWNQSDNETFIEENDVECGADGLIERITPLIKDDSFSQFRVRCCQREDPIKAHPSGRFDIEQENFINECDTESEISDSPNPGFDDDYRKLIREDENITSTECESIDSSSQQFKLNPSPIVSSCTDEDDDPAIQELRPQHLYDQFIPPLTIANLFYDQQFMCKWIRKYQYHQQSLYRLLPPYRLLNAYKLLLSTSLIKPFKLPTNGLDFLVSHAINNIMAAASGFDEKVYSPDLFIPYTWDPILNDPKNYKPITCPSPHESRSTTPTSTNFSQDHNDGNEQQEHNQPPRDNGNQDANNGSGDGGDGDDEKYNHTANDLDGLNAKQLLKIIEQQRITIQQQQMTILQQKDNYQQQQMFINTLQKSHQAMISLQNFSNSSLLALSFQTMTDVNQLNEENTRLKKEIEILKQSNKRLKTENDKWESNKIHQHLTHQSRSSPKPQKHREEKPKISVSVSSIKDEDDTLPPATDHKLNDYYCEPPTSVRVKYNVHVANKFTKEIIPSRISMEFDNVKCYIDHKRKCNCNGLYSWLDIDIAMQYNRNQHHNHDTRIYNTGFTDVETKEDLFCVVESVKDREMKTGKNKKKFPWKMKDQLYTTKMMMDEYDLPDNQLPMPVRKSNQFLNQSQQNKAIEAFLTDEKKSETLINTTRWCKIKIFSKINNNRRNALSITKHQFKEDLKKNQVFNNKEIKLIPIILFRNKHYNIHYIIIIKIDRSNIAISMVYDEKSNKVEVTGIHLDKSMICRQHQWVSLEHLDECHCLDNLDIALDDLKIGDIDAEMRRLRLTNKELIQENDNLKDKLTTIPGINADDDSPRSPLSDFKNGYESTSSSNISILNQIIM